MKGIFDYIWNDALFRIRCRIDDSIRPAEYVPENCKERIDSLKRGLAYANRENAEIKHELESADLQRYEAAKDAEEKKHHIDHLEKITEEISEAKKRSEKELARFIDSNKHMHFKIRDMLSRQMDLKGYAVPEQEISAEYSESLSSAIDGLEEVLKGKDDAISWKNDLLRKSIGDEVMQGIFKYLTESVMLIDDKYNVRWFSPACKASLEGCIEQGQDMRDMFFHEKAFVDYRNSLNDVIKEGKESYDKSISFRKEDGSNSLVTKTMPIYSMKEDQKRLFGYMVLVGNKSAFRGALTRMQEEMRRFMHKEGSGDYSLSPGQA